VAQGATEGFLSKYVTTISEIPHRSIKESKSEKGKTDAQSPVLFIYFL
jgi:hypothetical protein